MLFAVCCDRGAPGSTTTALALAAARGLPAVVVEADAYGGDLALRLRPEGRELATTPTVLAMGAGRSNAEPGPARPIAQTLEEGRPVGHRPNPAGPPGRTPVAGEPRHLDLWRSGSHELNEWVRVVPGFLTAEQGTSLAWRAVAATTQAQTVPVFADLGRIHRGSPSMPIATAADVLIPVCRGDRTSVQHMIWRLEQMVPMIAEANGRVPSVVPVVVTGRRTGARHAGQVAELLGETSVGPSVRGVGSLAWDPSGVNALEEGHDPWSAPLQRSPLMQSARKVIWLLGMTTGLSHESPDGAKRRGGRKKTDDPDTSSQTSEQTSSQPWVPTGQGPAPLQPPAQLSMPPAPPSTTSGAAVNGASVNGVHRPEGNRHEAPAEPPAHSTGGPTGEAGWQTSARSEEDWR